MNSKRNGVTTKKLKVILRNWKHGSPLPPELHPSVFRPGKQKEWPFWYMPSGKISQLRGLYHEELLKYLLERASCEMSERWLVKVVNVPTLGIRDMQGIDLTLITIYGKIQLQVKSSSGNRTKFFFERHSKGLAPMSCVVVNTGMSEGEILCDCVDQIKPFLLRKKQEKEAWDAKQEDSR